MTKVLSYLLLLLIGQSVAAREVVCNGLRFTIEKESTECTVIGSLDPSIIEVNIPSTIEESGVEYAVTRIAESAFYGNQFLQQVTIGNAIKEIGILAFRDCNSLKKVKFHAVECQKCELAFPESVAEIVIGDEVKSIPPLAFEECYELTSLDLGRGVENIGDYAFTHCRNLRVITLPASIKDIGYRAFLNVPFEKITIPATIETIGAKAFASALLNFLYFNAINCKQCSRYGESAFPHVVNITFGDNVENIPGAAFINCGSLEDINFGTSVKSIASEAFAACTALKHLTIDQNIAEIGQAAFKGCTSLQTLTIGKSVTTISGEAFKGCDSLKEITIEAEHLESCGTLWGSPFPEEVESVKMGKGVRNIPEYMFSGCRMLTGVDLSTAIEEIGNNAFQNCIRLEKIRLHEGVKTLGAKIFVGCSKLRAIESLSPEPAEADDNTFMSCDEVTLYVPEESVEKYRQARGWSRFKDIRPLDGSAIDEIEAEGHLEVKLTENGCVIPTGNYLTDIYDTTGRRVYRGNGGEIRLERGLYIVVSGRGTREKIAIR